MSRLWQLVICIVLLTSTVSVAQAQWVLAFEDKTRRDLNGVFFLDQRYGWIIGDGGIIHATQTSGLGWVVQYPKLKANMKDVYFRNREEGWVIASGGHILHTEDGGDNWSVAYKLTVDPKEGKQGLNSIAFAKKKGWVVGTNGRILFTEDGGQSWREQESGTSEELVH